MFTQSKSAHSYLCNTYAFKTISLISLSTFTEEAILNIHTVSMRVTSVGSFLAFINRIFNGCVMRDDTTNKRLYQHVYFLQRISNW